MGEIAIKVESLGKRYRIGERVKYKALRDTLAEVLYAPVRAVVSLLNGRQSSTCGPIAEGYIWALRDFSFEVRKGDVVGIIGPNGAGKSTLLKILSRITKPTEGHARIEGRVGSLLEVGTGFHPELTGRENVYLNSAILGMRKKEIDRKFDEIVAFAEVEKFIDTPVKHYSSGMHVRLAFAVAAHLEPEILLVDEVLAVGDASFQNKCMGKMGDVAKEGRTVLFVSHNMGAVRSLCEYTYLLDRGRLLTEGDPSSVISFYLSSTERERRFDGEVAWPEHTNAPGDDSVKLRFIRLIGPTGSIQSVFEVDKPIRFEIGYEALQAVRGMRINLQLLTQEEIVAFATTDHSSQPEQLRPGYYTSVCVIPGGLLNVGVYIVAVGAGIPQVRRIAPLEKYLQLTTSGSSNHGSIFPERWPGVVSPRLNWEVHCLE